MLDTASGRTLRTLSGAVAAVSASGERAIAAGRRAFELRNVADDTVVATLQGVSGGNMAVSPDARTIALVKCGPLGSIRTRSTVWLHPADGVGTIRQLQARAYGVGGCVVDFSPDGRWIAARTDESVEVFEVRRPLDAGVER